MKNILLINPPLYFSQGQPKALDASVPPLGLLYIASYVNKFSDQFQVYIVDIPAEQIDLKTFCQRLKRFKPFIVGLSAMTAQLQGAVELAEFIRYKCRLKTKISCT